jgi:hypothetical protein
LKDVADIPCTAANAYHVSSDTEVTRALGYPDYGKPKILSDDAGGVTAAEAKAWIGRACSAGEHYEHYDLGLTEVASSGVIIDSLADFPSESRNVLNYIKNQSCVSDLAPGGTLTRVNREFYWNGQQVNLIGHGWPGAVAGLNFNTTKYLDILEDHRVNFTRIWVIDQFTGLAVRSPQTPLHSNAILPFNGQISNGSVDLTSFNIAFLNRIKDFVQKASERGIVVQVTLFDRHGLLNKTDLPWGRWLGSPYNTANNNSSLFGAGASNMAPADFVSLCQPTFTQGATSCPIQSTHFNFIKAVRNELADQGNVIFEIMNEPLAAEWGEAAITAFHRWAADATLRNGAEKIHFGCYN